VTDPLEDDSWLADAGSRGLADRAVSRMDIDRAVAQLPEGCRAAFILHDIEGLEHREIGQVLGIAEGTSKSQVHKARMRLRAILGQDRSGT
jgi:RNA polymerase sigma-70 factor (ECF subfamily)